ncbi:methylated-DNA--[protein]-cysteine S-methyltransferase [Nocardioides mangrovicus]|uniref:Methylated-DNA--protein-cysteine methyltransferase n=1 Tax=Nocardioides mangrovicus TaxID=2478913 RepID=A0A3L8P6Z0_9ACTN|nr:methylated-DNA--[protein]-cysteine S-methyltransferase [Nocardioides mangrovicus]RLV50985.1 methylated-DNA--[protein]-cysteine S-methyltransferase [Nocardioides mangrovicus]
MSVTTTRTHTVVPSPVGELTLVLEGSGRQEALAGLYFPGHLRKPPVEGLGPRVEDAGGIVGEQLAAYFAGELQTFDLPLALRGNDFQLRVWDLLQQIPYGQTRSYGELARELGDVHWAQAVGHANAMNPVAVVVPCHRVIGADGTLTGYAGGIERKRFLLDLESGPPDQSGRLF